MKESEILHDIRLAVGQLPGVAVWRNQVGIATFPGGRKVPYGLCRGSSDIIGLRSIVIAPEHVGSQIAQFVAIEVKTDSGRHSLEQKLFLKLVAARGGLAITARTEAEAVAAVRT